LKLKSHLDKVLLAVMAILANLISNGQSPHGETFKINCANCHSSQNWTTLNDPLSFSHDSTSFILEGMHASVDCKLCHTSLIFSEAPSDCASCHNDVHRMTVGNDCARCHNSKDWLVDEIPELHEQNGFPLIANHNGLSCTECHISESNLEFNRIGNDCVSCHLPDYQNSKNPNHQTSGFSTNCVECHSIFEDTWSTEFVDHDFFPLTLGHDVSSCNACHLTQEFSDASPDCISCHEDNFNATVNPDHNVLGLSTQCATCHTTNPNWMPAAFPQHNEFYELHGAHELIANDCASCHNGDYVNTPNTCIGCHQDDFSATTNPDHETGGFSSDCLTCHNEIAWTPTNFDHNTTDFPISGGHIGVDCISCHANGYADTPTDCASCHLDDFNATTDPNHVSAQFSTDCIACHTNESWTPATFDHDGQHFPIYSGSHEGQWNECIECHTDLSDYSQFTCIGCHVNPETDESHVDVGGYTYNDAACLVCHPTGSADDVFDHSTTNFPLTGEHLQVNCLECHANGYAGTPTNCDACHQIDFNNSVNPNHGDLGLSNDCASCHTTEPDWAPASFAIHDDFYALNGAHGDISNECATCHNGDYVNTPNTCVGCHLDDFNATTNPDHEAGGFSNECATCHTETSWTPSTFDHNATEFPISGGHIGVECISCHADGYANTATDCASCHLDDYNATTDPNHSAAQFSTDCNTCHSNVAWTPATFDHDNQYFPIYSGSHEGQWTQCTDCHTNLNDYSQFTCVSCHTNPTTNNDHTDVDGYTYDDMACLVCHPTGSADDVFDHNSTNFQLTNAHIEVSCMECHASGFAGTPTNCDACHQTDFNNSVNPDHETLGLSTDCATCHTTMAGWAPATFAVHDDYYTLNGAHSSIANECASCHNGDYVTTPNTCAGCHMDDFNATNDPNHASAQFSTDCATCHNEEAWTPATFDHDAQYFPIYSGSHEGEWNQCNDCHNNPNDYSEFTCISCHTNPQTNNEHDGVSGYVYDNAACLACHPTGSADNVFDHNATNFQLTGEHMVADCMECHSAGFAGTPTNCDACHMVDFNSSVNPNHNVLGFSTDCSSCHTTDADWSPATFVNHDDYYVLQGAHAMMANDCAACHNGDYINTPNTCVGCHQSDFNATTSPNHQAEGFPTDCVLCHNENQWDPSTFDHNTTAFPISGGHIGVNCIECHASGYAGTPTECIACHQDDFNGATDPDHVDSQFPTDCIICHNDNTWTGAQFDHNNTNFPLTGEHVGVDCMQCHANGYTGTPTDCNACHTQDFQGSVNPDHQVLGFPTDCASCHTTDPDWMPASFDIHDNYYALQGAHALIANDCAACHNGNYINTPNTCVGCHQSDFNATTSPNHQAEGFPTDCVLCHNENQWDPSTFDHNTTAFPISGGHIGVNCIECHASGYAGTPTECIACHQDDFNGATDPDHVDSQFPTDCIICHNDNTWTGAQFDHNNTNFPLTGEHVGVDCMQCHANGYTGTPTECNACHTQDFQGSVNPDHQVLGFPTDCASCHTTDPDWMPASFDIHNNYYALQGAHAVMANECVTCHNGDYNNTPNTCVGCHQNDFNATTSPNHTSAMFPTDCVLCHSEDAWTPSTFDHSSTAFPLTGQHIPLDCIACHSQGYVGTSTECVSCHQSDYNATTNPDHADAMFPTDCVLCHTSSGWTPSSFDHNDTSFPLVGAHVAVDCNQCHANVYTGTPTECFACHQSDYNNANHDNEQYPTDCTICHSMNAWTPSTFDHDGDYFPIYSGTHNGEWNQCNDCHTTPGNFAIFNCLVCHTANQTNPDHDEVTGYQWNSNACLNCHPNGNN
jgi:hypothetical protein